MVEVKSKGEKSQKNSKLGYERFMKMKGSGVRGCDFKILNFRSKTRTLLKDIDL